MKNSHVIFGYTNDDVITDINRTCSMVTGKVNKNDTKKLVKKYVPKVCVGKKVIR